MKSILSLSCLAILISLSAFSFSGTTRNKATIVLQTQSGEIYYRSGTQPAILDESGYLSFDFKPTSFTSQNAQNDAILMKLTQEAAYHVVSFSGQLEKPINKLLVGGSLKTAAVGKLKFAGREQSQRVPVNVTRTSKGYVFTADAVIDWASNPATKNAGTELNISGPIRLNITPIIK